MVKKIKVSFLILDLFSWDNCNKPVVPYAGNPTPALKVSHGGLGEDLRNFDFSNLNFKNENSSLAFFT